MIDVTKTKKPLYKRWWVYALLVVIVVGVTGNLLGLNENNQDETEAASKTGEKSKSVGIGEELKVGDVVFKVNEISETQEISAANGMMKYTPEAEGATFLVVNVTVANQGKEMINTDTSFFELQTGDTEYSPSSVVIADEKFFMFEGINPGLSLTGNVLFEVPAGLTDLQLQVQTGFLGTQTGVIGLN